MISFGRLLGIPYLLCSNHTIHLAVTDKLFQERIREVDSESRRDSDDDSEDDEPSDVSDCEESSQIFEPAPDYQATIKKMPEIIKVSDIHH
jgi:hypothetical protein